MKRSFRGETFNKANLWEFNGGKNREKCIFRELREQKTTIFCKNREGRNAMKIIERTYENIPVNTEKTS